MQSQIEQTLVAPRARWAGLGTRVRANALAGLLILLIGLFYLATIREGHVWGDDFALYIHHAKNLVEGKPYADTGYIYNPQFAELSPRSYPPVFPLLLVPVYAFFGLNLAAMKVQGILFFVAALGMIYLTFKRFISGAASLALIALLGLNPYIWDFKDNIVSEMPFLFFLFLCLYLIERAYRSERAGQIANSFVLGIGLSLYLAYGTRSLGALLLPCLLLADVLRRRKLWPSFFALKVAALFLVCFVIQRLFVQGESSYFDQLVGDPGIVLQNFERYRFAFTQFWFEPFPWIVRTPAFALFALLALFGYLLRVRQRLTVIELLPLPYMAIILVWPSYQGNRFLLPMAPLFLFYALVGIEGLSTLRLQRLVPYALGGLLVVTGVSYALQVPQQDYPVLSRGIGTPEARELFAYLASSTEPDDVMIIQKPRIVSLLTGRPGAAYHIADNDAELWAFMREVNASYLISSREAFFRDEEYLHAFVERNQSELQQVYANPEFTVYRIK